MTDSVVVSAVIISMVCCGLSNVFAGEAAYKVKPASVGRRHSRSGLERSV